MLLDYLLLPTLAYVVSAAAMRAIVPSMPPSAWVLLFIVSDTAINLLGIETTARANRTFLAIQLVVIALSSSWAWSPSHAGSTARTGASGGGKAVGQATMLSLCLAAALFVAQTWIAVLLIPGRTLERFSVVSCRSSVNTPANPTDNY